MKCPRCLYDVVWQSDFSYEDFDIEGDGIVSYYSCQNCGVEMEVRYPLDFDE